MKSFESSTCHTKALSPCHTDYSCHTDSHCHTDSPPCHTERSEVSQNIESSIDSKRDFSLTLKMTRKQIIQK
nr:hypothetical protein [uncultured Helicobacter sp.]